MRKENIYFKKLCFPTIFYDPLVPSTNLVIHLSMSNTVKETIIMARINEANINYHFATFDFRGQGENKKPCSRFNNRYLSDIKKFIFACKQSMPHIKNVFLSGESWGANLAMLFAKKHSSCIKGCVCWNGTSAIVNIGGKKTNKKNENFFILCFKTVLTFFTNIETKYAPPSMEMLTDNRICLRTSEMNNKSGIKFSLRVIIACWQSMTNSWISFKKIIKSNDEFKFVYIQTKKDLYFHKNIRKLNKIGDMVGKNKEIIVQENGMHILSIDAINGKIIWEKLKQITS